MTSRPDKRPLMEMLENNFNVHMKSSILTDI